MNTNHILCKLTCLFSDKRVIFDCIPCDYLTTVILRNDMDICLVVNTEPSTHAGAHWVAIYIPKNSTRLFGFCSFGVDLRFYNAAFGAFFKRTKRRVKMFSKRLQGDESVTCGQYATYFLKRMVEGVKFSRFHIPFKGYEFNDAVIVKRVKCLPSSKVVKAIACNQSCCKVDKSLLKSLPN